MHFQRAITQVSAFKRHLSLSAQVASALTIKDVPRPRSLPLIGTKLDMLAAGRGAKLHAYVDKRHQQLGSIYAENLGGGDVIFISDPTLMKQLFIKIEGKYPEHIIPEPWILYNKLYGNLRGIFFMDGQEWLDNRRILNKALLKEDAESWIMDPITRTTKALLDNWKNRCKDGRFTPNLDTEFYRFSIDVIIAVLLGNTSIKTSPHHDQLMTTFSVAVKKIFTTTTKLYGLPVNLCQRWNMKVWRDFKDSFDSTLSLAKKIGAELMTYKHDSDGLVNKLSKENVPDEVIIRILADFIIAAGDTTSYTTLWTLYLLANNQNAIEESRANEAYVKNIVRESMRLYPVAPFLTRILTKECELGPYTLEKGTPIVASIFTSGRSENYFSQPTHFLPYRWDRTDVRRQELANHEPSASLPFAMGSRSCIGKKIALLQLHEVVSQIINNFDLTCTSENVEPITSQVLVPDKPINITFYERK